MIPRQAIQKAIQGGYGGRFDSPEIILASHSQYQLALSAPFWQALSKVLGWPEYAPICHRCNNIRKERYDLSCSPDGQCDLTGYDNSLIWNMYAHRFYDLILTGDDTDAFWEQFLTDKK